MKTLSQRMKFLRSEQIKQFRTEVFNATNCNKSSYHNWYHGYVLPNYETGKKIELLLDKYEKL